MKLKNKNKIKFIVTLRQAYNSAKKKISKKKWNWMNCGSEREYTLNENLNFFKKFKILQKILVDVSIIKTKKKCLGVDLKFPLIIAPMGYMTQFSKDGEIDLALAAKDNNTLICLSAVSSIRIDEILYKRKLNIIYQFYSLEPKKWVLNEIRKITKFGVNAICVTADSPVRSFKYDTLEDNYDARKHGRLGQPRPPLNHIPKLNWKDIKWLRKKTKLPIIIKGVMNKADAKKCFDHGADIIWVSNHGGRTLESGISSLEALIEIRKKFSNKQIIFDGGIRTGSDIFKSLCLGADVVAIGRPAIWGLILGGKTGVSRILDLFYKEFCSVMGLSGCNDIKKLSKKFIKISK